MPLLRRQPFTKQKPPPDLNPDEEVFHCALTNEVFRDYEQFFERIILCNSLVWTCSLTGKAGLTYQEALDSEAKAKKRLQTFPDYLQKPIGFIASLTHRSRLNDMNDDIFLFAKDRYFIGEKVDMVLDGKSISCQVMQVIAPPLPKSNGHLAKKEETDTDSDVICLDDEPAPRKPSPDPISMPKFDKFGPDPSTFSYMVLDPKKNNIYTVTSDEIGRKKGVYTREKSKLFLKMNCENSGDGIWKLKTKVIKRLKLLEAKFEDFFGGPLPDFVVGVAKKIPKGPNQKKSFVDLTEDDLIREAKAKKRGRPKKEDLLGSSKSTVISEAKYERMSAEEKAELKERLKQEKKALKIASKEEMQQRLMEAKAKLKEEREMEKQRLHQLAVEEKMKAHQQAVEEKLKAHQRAMEEKAVLRQKQKEEKIAAYLAMKEQRRTAYLAQREEFRQKMIEAKAKKHEEKMQRNKELEEEREKRRTEKMLMEQKLREWNRPRDDLNCDDLIDMPVPTPIQIGLQPELFGDIVMVLEYLNAFSSLFDLHEEFPDGITLEALAKALSSTDVSGLYFDLLQFLMTAVFNLQAEEQEEQQEIGEQDADADGTDEYHGEDSTEGLIKSANAAAQLPLLNYGTPLSKLQLDSYTITEILRLHILSSGASVSQSSSKFHYRQRGGFLSSDDPGLEFRRQEPELIKGLSSKSIFDHGPRDKLQILVTLTQQLLTYIACRDFMEDNFDKVRQMRYELRCLQAQEQHRDRVEATYWYRKRAEERAKEKEQELEKIASKKQEREDRIKLEEYGRRATSEKKTLEELLKELGEDELLQRMKEKADSVTKNTPPDSQEESKMDQESEEPTRRSSRQKPEKEKKVKTPEKKKEIEDIPIENIEWEKVTPEQREKWAATFSEKTKEMQEAIDVLQRGDAIYPIGRDRTFRRYWVFRSVPGLFVEDDEQYIPDDFLQPAPQKNMPVIAKSDIPLVSKSLNDSGEQKSTSSDKENDADNAIIGQIDNKPKAKVLSEISTSENSKAECMDIEMTPKEEVQKTMNVHEQIEKHKTVRWAYYHTTQELDVLIGSLNARGYREGPLKQALLEQKCMIEQSLVDCPVGMLKVTPEEVEELKNKSVKLQPVKSRNRTMQGVVQDASAEEFMELNLREMLLDIEERIFIGALGAMTVKSRPDWRDAIEQGSYDAQCDNLTWSGRVDKKKEGDEESMETDEDTAIPVVHDLARALLQIAQGIETKFLCPPLGITEDAKKGKPVKEKKEQSDSDDDEKNEEGSQKKTAMERWQESLMASHSLSQVFLHLGTLEQSIVWAKSALHARCRICRRKGDGDKMLLCDACDRGHHMYCLKPPVKKVPQGDWYCPQCRPKDIMRTPRKARRISLREVSSDEEEEESSEEDDDSDNDADSEDEDSDEEKDSDDESEEDDDSDETENDDSDESEVEEEQPAKVKMLKFGNRKKPASGRSTPNTTSGRSTRESSPVDNKRGTSRSRASSKSRQSLEKPQGRSRSSTGKVEEKGGRSRKSLEPTKDRGRARSQEPASKSRKSLEKNSKRKLSLDFESENAAKKIRGGESGGHLKKCENLLLELQEHDDAWPFLTPVTKRDAPDYFDIIKKPMDFQTIRIRVNRFEYTNPADILEDLRLIFTNCETYNVPTAEEYQCGQRLCRLFVKKVKEYKLDGLISKADLAKPTTSKEKTSPNTTNSRRTSRRN